MSATTLSPSPGGADLARGLLRVALGATMVAHGVKHWRTLEGTAGWFRSIGFRRADLQAKVSAGAEVAAGAALLTGAATPVAASAVVGTMTVAAVTVHRHNGFFVTDEGWEYVALIASSSVALSALGPGRVSVDHGLGADRRGGGVARGAFSALVGVAGAAAHLRMFWSPPSGTR